MQYLSLSGGEAYCRVRGTPPVEETGHIACGERLLDVIRPRETFTLTSRSIPVVVDGIKG